MHTYAQTNLQLFNQLRGMGYPEADLGRVDAGYRLMMRLMSAQYRPSGKTFLAHLVGTASILAVHGARPPLVLAGLAHAAYASGAFAARLPGIHPAKRRIVRQTIGDDAENVLADYSEVRWDSQAQDLTARFASLPATRRDAMFLRAANELEESLDSGLHYGAPERRLHGRTNLEQSRTFAELLTRASLAEEIARALRELETPPVPSVKTSSAVFSLTLHSASIPERCVLALKHRLARLHFPLFS